MLLCCSVLPASEKLMDMLFVKLISEWVMEKHRTEYGTLFWNGKSDLFCSGKKGGCFQVERFDDGKKCGVHFVSPGKYKKEDVQWISDFVLDSSNRLLAFQLNCEGYTGVDLPRSIPAVIRTFISEGYCSLDGNLNISEKPVMVTSKDDRWIHDIMVHEAKYMVPIVYISHGKKRKKIIDPVRFATQMCGFAHVIVEDSEFLTYKLRDLTGGKCPINGDVAVIFPDDMAVYTPKQLLRADTTDINTVEIIETICTYWQQFSCKNGLWLELLRKKKPQISNTIKTIQDGGITSMGKYIGRIKREGPYSEFFNFKPIAQIEGVKVIELTFDQQRELLPESEKRDINFKYFSQEKDKMNEMFPRDDSLAVFEFEVNDLQDNWKSSGALERNQTGYKVQAIEMMERGKIRKISEENIYYAVNKDKLLSDFGNNAMIQIDISYVCSGDLVFVEYGDDFWAGPYEVNVSKNYGPFIRPQIPENKYTLSGYYQNDAEIKRIDQWMLFVPNQGAVRKQFDVIDDEKLLEGFRESVRSNLGDQNMVSLTNLPALLKNYNDSVIAGALLTDEVRHSRLARLNKILTSEMDVSDALNEVLDYFCELLIKHQNASNVDEFLRLLISKNPKMLESVREVEAISTQIDQKEQKYNDLVRKVKELEIEKEKATEELGQAALREKDDELRKKTADYEDICAKFNEIQEKYGLAKEVVELQKKLEEDRAYEKFLRDEQNSLTRNTEDLRLKFDQFLYEQREKMVQIAFDGFVSSKMFRAAAEWDERESALWHQDLVAKVNAVPLTKMEPDELVKYLCRSVQEVRPNYTQNTIVNIAICLTQGFLTVFSGDPGCGKTSICNIFGDVLGLKQISKYVDCKDADKDRVNRYIPISVERGWTSKRDFIGYYNPLSKTFDTANRRVYDALRVLDTEKKENINRLPFVMLLDEANLSPMEYYWSDFMNICDDLGPQSVVNLGENFIFGIPETLHFFATINNDHTIEILSPRLIDRSWVISLPRQNNYDSGINEIPPEHIKIISWESLCQAFIPKKETKCEFSPEIKKVYNAIALKMKEQQFLISPRVYNAIKRYWVIASKQFEMDDTKTDPEIIAIDYAVAQRLLPKIEGNGEDFEKWLDEFKSLCSRYGLNESADRLNDIIERGKRQMKYFKFFC